MFTDIETWECKLNLFLIVIEVNGNQKEASEISAASF